MKTRGVIRLYNDLLRKELLIGMWHIVSLRQNNTGGIVDLSNRRSYVLDKPDYLRLRKAYLDWNVEPWLGETLIELPVVKF